MRFFMSCVFAWCGVVAGTTREMGGGAGCWGKGVYGHHATFSPFSL